MLIRLFNFFVKITGFPAAFFCFRTKIYYEDKSSSNRRIKGSAIIISNHTSVFDYAVYLFVFFSRTLRVQMAELLFKKKILGPFLRMLGGIYVNRNTHDFGFISKSLELLKKGWVVGVFPESRIPLPSEERPLPFKTSAAYLALASGVPVIPIYTNGSYFRKKRAAVVIGKPIDARSLENPSLTDRENLMRITDTLREKIIFLEKLYHEKNE